MTWERDAPQVFNNCSFAFTISMTNQLFTRRKKIICEQSSTYQRIAERPYQPSLLILAATTVASLLPSLSRMHGCISLSLALSVSVSPSSILTFTPRWRMSPQCVLLLQARFFQEQMALRPPSTVVANDGWSG